MGNVLRGQACIWVNISSNKCRPVDDPTAWQYVEQTQRCLAYCSSIDTWPEHWSTGHTIATCERWLCKSAEQELSWTAAHGHCIQAWVLRLLTSWPYNANPTRSNISPMMEASGVYEQHPRMPPRPLHTSTKLCEPVLH